MADGQLWVGIDAGVRSVALCVIDQGDTPIREALCPNDASDIDAILADYRERLALVGIEAGTGTHLTRKLREMGYPTEVFEARRARRFLSIRRNKTDESDARGLADLAKYGRGLISRVHVKTVPLQHLRSRLIMREKLVRQRVAADNLVRSLIRLHGGQRISTSTSKSMRKSVEAELARIEQQEGLGLHAEILPLLDLCERMRSYIETTDRGLEQTARQIDACRSFMTIPGVGPITALAFFATLGSPDRFQRSSDVAAYLGLVPRLHRSGTLSRGCGITKMGDKMTRRLLVMASSSMMRQAKESVLRQWGINLAARTGRAKARVAVARKLAIVMLTMWKSGSDFEPGQLAA